MPPSPTTGEGRSQSELAANDDIVANAAPSSPSVAARACAALRASAGRAAAAAIRAGAARLLAAAGRRAARADPAGRCAVSAAEALCPVAAWCPVTALAFVLCAAPAERSHRPALSARREGCAVAGLDSAPGLSAARPVAPRRLAAAAAACPGGPACPVAAGPAGRSAVAAAVVPACRSAVAAAAGPAAECGGSHPDCCGGIRAARSRSAGPWSAPRGPGQRRRGRARPAAAGS